VVLRLRQSKAREQGWVVAVVAVLTACCGETA
jgi:hypothetical protein